MDKSLKEIIILVDCVNYCNFYKIKNKVNKSLKKIA